MASKLIRDGAIAFLEHPMKVLFRSIQPKLVLLNKELPRMLNDLRVCF